MEYDLRAKQLAEIEEFEETGGTVLSFLMQQADDFVCRVKWESERGNVESTGRKGS